MASKRPWGGPDDEPGYDCTGRKFDCLDAYHCFQPDKCDPGAFTCPNSYGAEPKREPSAPSPGAPVARDVDPRLASLAERLSQRVQAAAAGLGERKTGTSRCDEGVWCGTKYETVCNEFDCRPGKFKCTGDAFRCENGFTG